MNSFHIRFQFEFNFLVASHHHENGISFPKEYTNFGFLNYKLWSMMGQIQCINNSFEKSFEERKNGFTILCEYEMLRKREAVTKEPWEIISVQQSQLDLEKTKEHTHTHRKLIQFMSLSHPTSGNSTIKTNNFYFFRGKQTIERYIYISLLCSFLSSSFFSVSLLILELDFAMGQADISILLQLLLCIEMNDKLPYTNRNKVDRK